MPYVHISDFKAGLDKRRLPISAVPGSLQVLQNAHITRGGEIEKRKSFESKYTLPAGTFGLAATDSAIYVFGSAVDPGVPSGVTYQRLQHPDGYAMTAIKDVEIYTGKVYAIAEFAGGDIVHFYDKVVVEDWINGVVRTAMTDTDGIASHLQALVDEDPNVSATVLASVVTVTGAEGISFDIVGTAENGDGNATDDSTLVVAETQAPVAGIAEVLPVGKLQINGGEPPTQATGSIDITSTGTSVLTITVDSVDVLGATVPFNTDVATTASDCVDQINSFSSTPEYTATLDGATITIIATAEAGSGANGLQIAATAVGVTLGNIVHMGSAIAGITREVTDITVDAVSVMTDPVIFTVSNSGTVSALATEINGTTSSPNYTAVANGGVLELTAAAGVGAGPNGFIVKGFFTNDATIVEESTPPVETPVAPDPEPPAPEPEDDDPFQSDSG